MYLMKSPTKFRTFIDRRCIFRYNIDSNKKGILKEDSLELVIGLEPMTC